MGTNWEDQIWGPRKPRRSPADSGNNRKSKGCCPMVEAGRAVRRRKFRLARRYAMMSLRLLSGCAA
jgi:hypothetical protein